MVVLTIFDRTGAGSRGNPGRECTGVKAWREYLVGCRNKFGMTWGRETQSRDAKQRREAETRSRDAKQRREVSRLYARTIFSPANFIFPASSKSRIASIFSFSVPILVEVTSEARSKAELLNN